MKFVVEKENIFTEALDHAIIEADKSEGLFYEDLSFEACSEFDNSSEPDDIGYLGKIHRLVTNEKDCWEDIAFTKNGIDMFNRRMRSNWSEPDSIYDAWLIRNGHRREWFRYDFLTECFDADEYLQSKKRKFSLSLSKRKKAKPEGEHAKGICKSLVNDLIENLFVVIEENEVDLKIEPIEKVGLVNLVDDEE